MKEGVFLGGGGIPSEQNAITDAFNYNIDLFSGATFWRESSLFSKKKF